MSFSRRPLAAFALPVLLAVAVVAAACEKDNAIVVQEQLRDNQQVCAKGCEVPPPGCDIKGNISAMGNKFYHLRGGRYYAGITLQTENGERWFCTEAEAIDNGWRRSAE